MKAQTMRRLTVGLVVIAIAASACSSETSSQPATDASGSAEQSATSQAATSQDMSPIAESLDAEIAKAMERQSLEEVFVVDVRTDEEWNESHVVDAVHWGLEEHLKNGELPAIDKDAEIYVYCRSGNRSGQAIKIMQEAGYTNLINIGGLEDWVTSDGKIVSGVDTSDQ